MAPVKSKPVNELTPYSLKPEEPTEAEMEHDPNRTELSKLEIELCKQNFSFYDRNRVGSVERFELPMLLNGKAHR